MNARNDSSTQPTIKSIFHFFMILLVSCSIITFAGCGSDDTPAGPGGNGGNNNNEPGANEVWMVGTSFTPSNLEVTVGTTVTWTNQSDLSHTVTSGNPGDADEGDLFDSGTVTNGQAFSYTFDEVGEYEYFCIPHASNMQGTITVVEE